MRGDTKGAPGLHRLSRRPLVALCCGALLASLPIAAAVHGTLRSAARRGVSASATRTGSSVAVYTDQAYWRAGDEVYASRAFVVFLSEVARSLDKTVVVGRLSPTPGRSHYRLDAALDFAPLPWYSDASSAIGSARALLGSVRALWRVLDGVDRVWVLGPYPLSIVLVGLAALRRRKIVLGVRQDMPRYIRSRRPHKRALHLIADGLEWIWRALSRRYPVVVVGPDLASNYRAASKRLEAQVSLVSETQISDGGPAPLDDEVTIITVGRLDWEKNPLMLADVLARLRERDQRWRMVICGDGALERELAERIELLGLTPFAELRGHVPIDAGLMDVYRASDLFLHVSLTEGMPQVLLEAFAAGLPVVATAVGGVERAVGDAALLVQPGDVDGAASALERLLQEEGLRRRLVRAGTGHIRAHTMEIEAHRVASFIADGAVAPPPRPQRSRRFARPETTLPMPSEITLSRARTPSRTEPSA